jgi:hypothetical protein
VRESQIAVFVNEGRIADVFGPGTHTLTTRTLPVLTNLLNWDKLFDSPFKSDVYFFSTRVQTGRKWGTPQPITIRDKDFDMIRVRAFGMYSYRVADPRAFFTEISGTREMPTPATRSRTSCAASCWRPWPARWGANVAFLDMAANQALMAQQVRGDLSTGLRPLRHRAGRVQRCQRQPAGRTAGGARRAHLGRHEGLPVATTRWGYTQFQTASSDSAGGAERRRPGRHRRGTGRRARWSARPWRRV